jgi:Flp pilus assembly protein TadD
VASLTAAALTCLAGDLNQSRLWKQSDLLLERATDLDASSGLTLLLLAANRERFGEYGRAADLLRRAVQIDPRADEARLRLGINLRRLGRLDEAERMLRRLTAVRAEGWLQVLAYQELAQLLLQEGRIEEAERELRVALSRHREHQGLHVLLAYVLERLGAPGEAIALLNQVPTVSPDEPSPRYRYAQPRAEILGALRASVRRNAEVRLPRLARALSAAAGE